MKHNRLVDVIMQLLVSFLLHVRAAIAQASLRKCAVSLERLVDVIMQSLVSFLLHVRAAIAQASLHKCADSLEP